MKTLTLIALALALVVPSAAQATFTDGEELALIRVSRGAIFFTAVAESAGIFVQFTGPGGCNMAIDVKRGDTKAVDVRQLEDGPHSFEIRPIEVLDPRVEEIARAARAQNDLKTLKALRAAGDLPQLGIRQSGGVLVVGGEFVDPEEQEPQRRRGESVELSTNGENVLNTLDFVIADDLIVDGSACIGFDCVNGESFGFDTIRLKENNLRIKFEDTSTAASFPTTDWQLTANASANGGASKFSIDDISGGRTPFTVEANAPSHSLYVDDGGRLGLGTSTPVADVHIIDGDTPTLRLEQNGSSGFAPQTWDVAGNETSFFIRDSSNGSTLPFRIRPGSPSQALVIDTDGDVGVGVLSPTEKLHIQASNNTATVRVEDTGNSPQDLLQLVNNGVVRFRMEATDSGNNWQFRVGANSFNFTKDGTGGNEFEVLNDGTVNMGPGGSAVFSLDPTGNLAIDGTLSEGSDRNSKHDIQPVDRNAILERVSQLPLSTWRYIKDDSQAQHLGPMAQDFSALFGLGSSDKRIGVLDMSGVALASIQALNEKLESKEQSLDDLRSQNEALQAQNDALQAQNERLEALSRSIEERLAALEAAAQK